MPNPNAIRDGAIIGSIVSFAILMAFGVGFWWLKRWRRKRKYQWKAHAEANATLQQKNFSMQQERGVTTLKIPLPPGHPSRADNNTAARRAKDRVAHNATTAPKPWTFQWLQRQAAPSESSLSSQPAPPTVSELGNSAPVGTLPTATISSLDSYEHLPKTMKEKQKGKQKAKEVIVVQEMPIEEGGPADACTETSSVFAVQREGLERALGKSTK
jgi:hypothetical protein